jgi:hypothetical protein
LFEGFFEVVPLSILLVSVVLPGMGTDGKRVEVKNLSGHDGLIGRSTDENSLSLLALVKIIS